MFADIYVLNVIVKKNHIYLLHDLGISLYFSHINVLAVNERKELYHFIKSTIQS